MKNIMKILIFILLSLSLTGCEQNKVNYNCPDCNVILISIENLRYDKLGCYGYYRNTSPNIDQLCKKSIVFENAYSQSGLSQPSFSSLFSSLYPSFHQVKTRGEILDSSIVTFPEILNTQDIENVAFVMGNNDGIHTGLNEGFDSRGFYGFDQGFDEYNDHYNVLTEIIDDASAWVKKNQNKRFFMFVQTYDIHAGYYEHLVNVRFVNESYNGLFQNKDISADTLGRIRNYTLKTELGEKIMLGKKDQQYIIDKYDEQIPYVDQKLKKFFTNLKNSNLMDNTLIIIMSGHGQELFERGRVGHGSRNEPVLHIPLIFKYPGLREEKRIQSLVQVIDIAPTILDFLGIDIYSEFQGKSLLPLIENNTPINDYILAERFRSLGNETLIRFRNWSLIITNEPSLQELLPLLNKGLINNKSELLRYIENYNSSSEKFLNKYKLNTETKEKSDELYILRLTRNLIMPYKNKAKELKNKILDHYKIEREGRILAELSIYSEELRNFKLKNSIELAQKTLSILNKGKAHLKLEQIKNITKEEANSFMNSDLSQINGIFLNYTSPYPGDVTNIIECPKEFRPVFHKMENDKNLRQYLTTYSNNRFGLGVCSWDLVEYENLIGWIYCPNNQNLYKIQYYLPIEEDKEKLIKFFLSLKCTVID